MTCRDPQCERDYDRCRDALKHAEEELVAAQEALRAIRDMPNEHDLLFNAEAKALWYVADEALSGRVEQ